MSFLLNNGGGRVLLSGRTDGSAVLLSGLGRTLIDVFAILSVSESSAVFVTFAGVPSVTENAVQEATRLTTQSISEEHVQDVD